MIGHTLGAYRVMRELGGVAFGAAYLAQHESGLAVHLRALPRDFGDTASLMRWQQIATAAAQTGHPGVQGVYEYLRDNHGNAYLVTELVPGEPIAAALARDHRFYPEIAAKLAWQIAAAVGTAHEAGILHGLLKAENIYVMSDPTAGYRVKVCEFGFHAFLPDAKPDWASARAMQVIGMPFYLAPETCDSGRRDHRSDIYSLGCLLFHMACGRPPYVANSPFELAAQQVREPQRRASNTEAAVPHDLDSTIWHATQKEAAQRPGSMRDLATALERIVMQGQGADPSHIRTVMLDVNVASGKPKRRGKAVHIVAGAIVALGAAAGGYLVLTRRGTSEAEDTPPPVTQPQTPPVPKVDVPAPADWQKDLVAAVDAIEAERWEDAEAAAKQVLAASPHEAQAEKILRWAKLGPKHRAAYKDFRRAVDDKDKAAARRRFARIPDDGPYHDKAKRELDAMK